MKHIALLSLLVLGCVLTHGAPVEQAALEQGSCDDAQAKFTGELALTKINQDREEGYILALHRLSNVHMKRHGETGVVFYLTLDVVETNCSVLSKKDWKTCEVRSTANTPVYGQCKAAIYVNRPHRVVRLYKYSCTIRPVPAAQVQSTCPDCPSHIGTDNAEVQKAMTLSMQKFNKEGGMNKRYAPVKIERATAGMAMSMYYNVEYSIQETTCANTVVDGDCPLMSCEFTHKGFCKASLYYSPAGEPDVSVECEIYEPAAAQREKILHDKAEDHAHTDSATTHSHDHSHAHPVDHAHTHDHQHDHTASHTAHDATHKHDPHHHHTHSHGAGHSHSHGHSHDHGDNHDHTHAHHAKAHDHAHDFPNQHHDYKHTGADHTHEHDHEIALDHDHKHPHEHGHEHHHHHHDHKHDGDHDHPEGMVRVLPAMDQPMTLPSFPDVPAAGPEAGVPLVLKPDPQIPDLTEPFIEPFPTTVSGQCSPPPQGTTLVEKAFAEDPMFLPA
ncbi:fetuin B [Halichoeres trimaculatus]|uniref:fetuin B n=1 Tax=Halichoeres trimaculatus TaxID=147232 RepID=UPI003D9F0ECD